MLGTAKAGILKPDAGRPIPGLLAAYAFKEGSGTSTADATGNGNTGTLGTNSGWVSGKWGTGGVTITSGTTTTITFGSGPSVSPPYNGISWCVWAKLPTSGWPDYGCIFGRLLGSGSTRSGLATVSAGSFFYVFRWRDDLQFGNAGALPNDGAWHHYAMVDGNTTWAFYMDGVSIVSGTRNLSPFTPNTSWEANPWTLGCLPTDFVSLPGTSWSDLRLFQGQLSINQVAAYMNAPV